MNFMEHPKHHPNLGWYYVRVVGKNITGWKRDLMEDPMLNNPRRHLSRMRIVCLLGERVACVLPVNANGKKAYGRKNFRFHISRNTLNAKRFINSRGSRLQRGVERSSHLWMSGE
jgi:hypothetical protein